MGFCISVTFASIVITILLRYNEFGFKVIKVCIPGHLYTTTVSSVDNGLIIKL